MRTPTALLAPCVNAWTHCMHLLQQLRAASVPYSFRTQRVLEECADISLGTLQALQSNFPQTGALALLCVGICEECAELCGRYAEPGFGACAAACRQCSEALSGLAAEGAASALFDL